MLINTQNLNNRQLLFQYIKADLTQIIYDKFNSFTPNTIPEIFQKSLIATSLNPNHNRAINDNFLGQLYIEPIVNRSTFNYYELKNNQIDTLNKEVLPGLTQLLLTNRDIKLDATRFDRLNKEFLKRYAELILNQEHILLTAKKNNYLETQLIESILNREQEEIINSFLDEISDALHVKAWISGINLDEEMFFEINEGVGFILRPINDDDYKQIQVKYNMSINLPLTEQDNFPRMNEAIILEFDVQANTYKPIFIETILQVISLFSLSSTYVHRLDSKSIFFNDYDGPGLFTGGKNIKKVDLFILNIDQSNKDNFLNFMKQIFIKFMYSKYLLKSKNLPLQILFNKYHNLLILDYANEEINLELSICLESLFLLIKEGEITYKLKMRTSKLADLIDSQNPQEVQKSVQRVYDLRSQYLHTLNSDKISLGEFRVCLELIRSAFLVMMNCFYLENNDSKVTVNVTIDKDSFISNLDKALYSSKDSKSFQELIKVKLLDTQILSNFTTSS